MKKLFLILSILFVSTLSFSQDKSKDMDWDSALEDVKEWVSEIDTGIIEPSKKIGKVVKEDIKKNGILKHLKDNRRVYLPLTFIILLYIMWLRGRSSSNNKE